MALSPYIGPLKKLLIMDSKLNSRTTAFTYLTGGSISVHCSKNLRWHGGSIYLKGSKKEHETEANDNDILPHPQLIPLGPRRLLKYAEC